MKALHVRSKLIYSLLMGVAQSLVKYANIIESYLPRDYPFEDESADKKSIQKPPAHWIEKVTRGAPHLLEQNTDGNEQDFFFTQTEDDAVANTSIVTPPAHWLEKVKQGAPQLLDQDTPVNELENCSVETVEAEIEQKSNVSYKQENRLKQKPVKQFVYKKSDKVFASINKLFRESKSSILMPSAFVKRNTPISNLKLNQKTVTKTATTINKTTGATLANKSSNIDMANVDDLAIKKTVKDQKIDKKLISQKMTGESLNSTDKARNEVIRTPKQSSCLTERDLLNRKNRIHLYPRPSFKTNTKQSSRDNALQKEKFEWNKQTFTVNNEGKNFKASGTHQQNLFSTHIEAVVSKTTHVPSEKDKLMAPRITQPAKLKNAEDMFISSDNPSHRIKTKPPQSSLIKWSSTKSEKNEAITSDRWPQLPKQEWQQPKDSQPHSVGFWRAQNQVESKFLSDLEQRGGLWNA